MAKVCSNQSSLQNVRPLSASQLNNEENFIESHNIKHRPYSAHNDSQTLMSRASLVKDRESTSEISEFKTYKIDPTIEKMITEFKRNSRAQMVKKKKDASDNQATIDAWLAKCGTEERRKVLASITFSVSSLEESDEYDTDIEEESEGEAEEDDRFAADPTGIRCYKRKCKSYGNIPVSYIQRNIDKRNMRMRHHYLGPEGTKPIAEALKVNTVTENVDLSDNYLKSQGAKYISKMLLDNMFIVNLNLSNNFIGTNGVAAISNMIQYNTTLKTLSLSGNQLTDRDAIWLVEGIKNNETLQSLDISNNNIGELGGIFLGNVLTTNDSLLDLDLSWNCIRGKGAFCVSQALRNNETLEVLDLSWNGIGLEGARGLQRFLPVNKKLRVLDLTNNRLLTEAAKNLSIGLRRNKVLETINLNQNAMKDEGVEAILKAVKLNTTIKLVSLEEIGINENNHNLIQELCDERDITILYGGTGGYKRPSAITSMLNIFRVFLEKNKTDMICLFMRQDKEKTGILNSDEIKNCMKEAGLRMTNRQLDMLLEEIDSSNTGNISYNDLLDMNVITTHFKHRTSICQSPINADPKTLSAMMKAMGTELKIT